MYGNRHAFDVQGYTELYYIISYTKLAYYLMCQTSMWELWKDFWWFSLCLQPVPGRAAKLGFDYFNVSMHTRWHVSQERPVHPLALMQIWSLRSVNIQVMCNRPEIPLPSLQKPFSEAIVSQFSAVDIVMRYFMTSILKLSSPILSQLNGRFIF